MSQFPIQALLLYQQASLDYHIVNEIKDQEPCIEFTAITSDPELVLELFHPDRGVEVAVVGRDISLQDGTPFYKYIHQNFTHIPIILLDPDLQETLAPKSQKLPTGIFMAIPAQSRHSKASMVNMENYLRQSIIYVGNIFRRLQGKVGCCTQHKESNLYSTKPEQFSGHRSELKEKGPSSSIATNRRRAISLEELIAGETGLGLPIKRTKQFDLLVIGVSTGGPEALKLLFQGLPKNFPAPIILVQHINTQFILPFQENLNRYSKLPVELAQENTRCRAGKIYISPGRVHLGVYPGSVPKNIILKLSNTPARNSGHVPSVGHLFRTISDSHVARSTVALIMTGMGEDGSAEIGQIKKAGGFTLAQDELSSNVFGMPKIAIELGNIDCEVPLQLLAPLLCYLFRVPEVK